MFSAAKYCGIIEREITAQCRNKHSLISMEEISTGNLYQHAVMTLNQLQGNNASLNIENNTNSKLSKLEKTRLYLSRIGVSSVDLDRLSVIHVSGTKGKGSTCALTESILRTFGLKTGFFSSPHLISVTERIRLNGNPISYDKFSKYFWKIFNQLNESKANECDMPGYFQFLTILSFYIFLEEEVDVAIIEVGIGGENDCTNCIENTKTVGISSLGLDHIKILGNSIDKIAWHKAGIIKEGSNVFTVNQPNECVEILKQRAAEKNAKLHFVPKFKDYYWKQDVKLQPKLQIQNKVQLINASLAIELANDWLRQNKKHYSENEENLLKIKEGLEKCFWPGRCQIIKHRNYRFYLDGAHTIESMKVCIDWFMECTIQSENIKVLIFNTTGERDSITFIKMLQESKINFKQICFVPNIISDEHITCNNSDVVSSKPKYEQISRAKYHCELWNNFSHNDIQINNFDCIVHALESISNNFCEQSIIEILITGSIHLVGNAMLAIEEFDRIKNLTK